MSQYIPVQSGPWSEDATWGPIQGHPPGETDTALINQGHTITIDTNIKVKQITLANGGLLVADDTTPTIEVTDGLVLARNLRPMPFRLDGAAFMTFCAPCTFVLIHSSGLYSAVSTCLIAAA